MDMESRKFGFGDCPGAEPPSLIAGPDEREMPPPPPPAADEATAGNLKLVGSGVARP